MKIHGGSGEAAQDMKNITVEVIESLFELNGCRSPNHTYFGGGIHLTFSDILLDQSTINIVIIL